MAEHALVVGGDIHHRLQRRSALMLHGFHVTLEKSVRRGLMQLERFPFALCELDLDDVPAAEHWRRGFERACSRHGTRLAERPVRRFPALLERSSS